MISPMVIPKVTGTVFSIAVFATASAFYAFAQSGQRDLHFEVASVKRSDPSRAGFGQLDPLSKPFTCDPGRCVAAKQSLSALVWVAYGIQDEFHIEMASSWMQTEQYDIAAKVPDGATKEQVHIMLQRLLAGRLGLVVHRETRQLPGFRLVVAKGGAKLRKAVDEDASADASGPDVVIKNGKPQFSSSAKSGVLLTPGAAILRGRHENMSGLAHQLSERLGAPIIEATGIEGNYDYDVSFRPEPRPQPKGSVVFAPPPIPSGDGAAGGQLSPATPSDRPVLSIAIREQLGLQLEAVKSVPVEVLVLDKANREPTEN